MSKKTVVITGALGFIGSHTAKAFKEAGYAVIGIDISCSNSSGVKYLDTYIKDDFETMAAHAAKNSNAVAVIHIAGASLVGPSITNPGLYYDNNAAKTNKMLQTMHEVGWYGTVVFSSSAAIYGNTFALPWDEYDIADPVSPYGRSKLMAETIINDHCYAHGFKGIALRYFNACGCDANGELGNTADDSHLVPKVVRSLVTKEKLVINGSDFDTEDGTCIRDYLHVTDIASAHLAAVNLAETLATYTFNAYNLATGTGTSNLSIIHAVEKITGEKVNYSYGRAREGDPGTLIANPNRFMKLTDWKPVHSDLHNIVQTTYDWMKKLDYSIEN
jgi:UDP-glucose-4-epimerase GalE